MPWTLLLTLNGRLLRSMWLTVSVTISAPFLTLCALRSAFARCITISDSIRAIPRALCPANHTRTVARAISDNLCAIPDTLRPAKHIHTSHAPAASA